MTIDSAFRCPVCGGSDLKTQYAGSDHALGICRGKRDPETGRFSGCIFRWRRRDDAMYFDREDEK